MLGNETACPSFLSDAVHKDNIDIAVDQPEQQKF